MHVVWFMRDLRTRDHAPLQRALQAAAHAGGKALLLQVFEPGLLAHSTTSSRHLTFQWECGNDVDFTLRQEGWGVVLHVADAESVCAQVEDIARKQYAAHCRAHPESRKHKFDVKHIAGVLDLYKAEEARSQEYIMGFTIVPPNMMRGGLQHFPPVDAIDAA